MGDEGLWGGCVVLLGPGRDEGPQGGVGREDPVISVAVDACWRWSRSWGERPVASWKRRPPVELWSGSGSDT